MVREKILSIKTKKITVAELTVRQVRDLLLAGLTGDHERVFALELSTGLSAADIDGLGRPEDLLPLLEAFKTVNPALLDPAPAGSGAAGRPAETSGKIVSHLDALACRLIMAGHVNVFDYGYSFFLTALKQLPSDE